MTLSMSQNWVFPQHPKLQHFSHWALPAFAAQAKVYQGLPYLKIPWLAAAQADSKQKWPLSLAARPAMWEGPETQSARLFGDFERSANHGILGRPRIFPFFFETDSLPVFFFRNPSSKVLRKKVARINPSWDKAMFHCWHCHLPIWSRWKLVKFLCECRGWTRKDCLALRIHTQRYVVLMRFFNDPEFGLCMFMCPAWKMWMNLKRYGTLWVSLPTMATGLQLLVPLAEQQGDQVGEKLQLPPPSWRFWLILTDKYDQWFNGLFLYSFHIVRWKPSFLRILFELAATETTSRRVQGHLDLRRQERTKNMSCCFSLPFKCTSLPGFLWKIMGKRQSPMAYHHSPIKHCYFVGGISNFSHNFWQLSIFGIFWYRQRGCRANLLALLNGPGSEKCDPASFLWCHESL